MGDIVFQEMVRKVVLSDPHTHRYERKCLYLLCRTRFSSATEASANRRVVSVKDIGGSVGIAVIARRDASIDALRFVLILPVF